MTRYQNPRNVRREYRTPVDKIKAGKLYPAMAIAVRPSEGGVVSHEVTFELDPIMGRMLTPIYAEVTDVFCPVQAIDAIKDPAAQYAGMSEVVRAKLLSGNPLFGLENEGEITKRCDVKPQSIGGVKRLSEVTRLAYNVAVNHLRQRKYVNAALLLHSNTAITPAILSQTILDRLNGVLDPDPKINGQVQLQLPTMALPVKGLGYTGTVGASAAINSVRESDGKTSNYTSAHTPFPSNLAVRAKGSGANARPDIFAQLDGVMAGSISLDDLHIAQRTDDITREIRRIIDENPEYGEEYAVRYAHGLSLDKEGIPFVLGHRRVAFNPMVRPAVDQAGVTDDVMRSDMVVKVGMTIPVPRTELGGIIITLVSIKPDEVIPQQPHPILSKEWGLDNFVADELEIDPKPVTIRELDADCAMANENTVAFYNGYNGLKQAYISYGLTRNVNPDTVENKTRVWQYELPMSVTPENILYPENLSQYPWADQVNEICTVVCQTSAVLPTPMILGPTPVEDLATIPDEDIFEN